MDNVKRLMEECGYEKRGTCIYPVPMKVGPEHRPMAIAFMEYVATRRMEGYPYKGPAKFAERRHRERVKKIATFEGAYPDFREAYNTLHGVE